MQTAMNYDTMMLYLSRRADHLAKRVAEAEAAGRVLTYDRLELAALTSAMERLQASAHRDVQAP